jgi:hypothetical protein
MLVAAYYDDNMSEGYKLIPHLPCNSIKADRGEGEWAFMIRERILK